MSNSENNNDEEGEFEAEEEDIAEDCSAVDEG